MRSCLPKPPSVGFHTFKGIPTDSPRFDGIWSGLIGLLLLGVVVISMHQLQLWRLRGLVEAYSEQLEQNTKNLRDRKEARSLHRIITPALMALVLLGVFFFIALVALPA